MVYNENILKGGKIKMNFIEKSKNI